MPRDGSGTYTLPAGNPVIAGTPIEAPWANSTLNDVATALTGSLPRSGVAPMLAPFRAFNGTESAPGIVFAGEVTSGWYFAGAGDLRFSIQAQDNYRYTMGAGPEFRPLTEVWDELTTSWVNAPGPFNSWSSLGDITIGPSDYSDNPDTSENYKLTGYADFIFDGERQGRSVLDGLDPVGFKKPASALFAKGQDNYMDLRFWINISPIPVSEPLGIIWGVPALFTAGFFEAGDFVPAFSFTSQNQNELTIRSLSGFTNTISGEFVSFKTSTSPIQSDFYSKVRLAGDYGTYALLQANDFSSYTGQIAEIQDHYGVYHPIAKDRPSVIFVNNGTATGASTYDAGYVAAQPLPNPYKIRDQDQDNTIIARGTTTAIQITSMLSRQQVRVWNQKGSTVDVTDDAGGTAFTFGIMKSGSGFVNAVNGIRIPSGAAVTITRTANETQLCVTGDTAGVVAI